MAAAEKDAQRAEEAYEDLVGQYNELIAARNEDIEGTGEPSKEYDKKIKELKAKLKDSQAESKEAIKAFSRSQKAYIDGLRKVEEAKMRKAKLEDPLTDRTPKVTPRRDFGYTPKPTPRQRTASTSTAVGNDLEERMRKIALQTFVSVSEPRHVGVALSEEYGFEDTPPREALERFASLTKRKLLGDETEKKGSLSLDLVTILLNDLMVTYDLSSRGLLKLLLTISVDFAYRTIEEAIQMDRPISEVLDTLRNYYDRDGLTKSKAKDDLNRLVYRVPHRRIADIIKYVHDRTEVLNENRSEAVVEAARECRSLFKTFFDNAESVMNNALSYLELSVGEKPASRLLVELLDAAHKHLPHEVPAHIPTAEDANTVSSAAKNYNPNANFRQPNNGQGQPSLVPGTHKSQMGSQGARNTHPRRMSTDTSQDGGLRQVSLVQGNVNEGPRGQLREDNVYVSYDRTSWQGLAQGGTQQPQRLDTTQPIMADCQPSRSQNEGKLFNWGGVERRCLKCGSDEHSMKSCDVYEGYISLGDLNIFPCCGYYHSDKDKFPCKSRHIKEGFGYQQVSSIREIIRPKENEHEDKSWNCEKEESENVRCYLVQGYSATAKLGDDCSGYQLIPQLETANYPDVHKTERLEEVVSEDDINLSEEFHPKEICFNDLEEEGVTVGRVIGSMTMDAIGINSDIPHSTEDMTHPADTEELNEGESEIWADCLSALEDTRIAMSRAMESVQSLVILLIMTFLRGATDAARKMFRFQRKARKTRRSINPDSEMNRALCHHPVIGRARSTKLTKDPILTMRASQIRIKAPLIGHRPFVSASLHKDLPSQLILLDTGAGINMCTRSQYERLKKHDEDLLLQPEDSIELRSQTNHLMKVLGSVRTDLHFDDSLGKDNTLKGVKFYVVEDPVEGTDQSDTSEILLGGSLLKEANSDMSYRGNHVVITLQNEKTQKDPQTLRAMEEEPGTVTLEEDIDISSGSYTVARVRLARRSAPCYHNHDTLVQLDPQNLDCNMKRSYHLGRGLQPSS